MTNSLLNQNSDLSVDIGDNQPEADGNHHACDDLLIAFPVDITDTAHGDEIPEHHGIKQEIMAHNEVRGVYDIILHNYGPDVMIGSLHIGVLDTLSAHDIHGLTRRIATEMSLRHGIIMTVGIYAVATGENQRAGLQSQVMKALAAHKELEQVHAFYYSEKDRMLSVDVVPDIDCHDDQALCRQLTAEIQALVPDTQVVIVIDHNYSEA